MNAGISQRETVPTPSCVPLRTQASGDNARKMRVRFRLQSPDAKTESLAFEVGQVPDLFHRREGAGGAGRSYFLRRERLECLAKERLHCSERLHQFVSLKLGEPHVLHGTSLCERDLDHRAGLTGTTSIELISSGSPA